MKTRQDADTYRENTQQQADNYEDEVRRRAGEYDSKTRSNADEYAQQVRDKLTTQSKVIEGNIQGLKQFEAEYRARLTESSASCLVRCPIRTTTARSASRRNSR